MEKLYIKVIDGKCVDHPITEWNLKMFFPDLSQSNIPEGFEKFRRTDPPETNRFQYYEALPYKKIRGVWTDNWKVVDISEEEKQEIIKKEKELFLFKDTWIWNEATFQWEPPIPYPNDGIDYFWNNDKKEWHVLDRNKKY